MSATILGRGNASLLMDTDYMKGTPQVHLHFLTGEQEYDEIGFGKVELCCHGCGEAVLLYYTEEDPSDRCLEFRDQFTQKHANCQNHGFEKWCPDYRSSTSTKDMRVPLRAPRQIHIKPRQTTPEARDKVPTEEFIALPRRLAVK
jgi:hypothetical protein